MSAFLGPLDAHGRIPPSQQTRVGAFLASAHGALARQFGAALPLKFDAAWECELNAQFYRESEIVSLVMRATSWVPDLHLGYLAAVWEMAWLPPPAGALDDRSLDQAVHLATLSHAIHAATRPAALLPIEASATDPFVMALRRIEFESGRMLQAQIVFLKGPELMPFRGAVSSALAQRHAEVRRLWQEMLQGIGIGEAV